MTDSFPRARTWERFLRSTVRAPMNSLRWARRCMSAIDHFPAPVYAAISGYCMGGGLDLALACHHRIASPRAVFGHRGAALRLITGWGGTQRLPRLIGKGRALEMFVAARRKSRPPTRCGWNWWTQSLTIPWPRRCGISVPVALPQLPPSNIPARPHCAGSPAWYTVISPRLRFLDPWRTVTKPQQRTRRMPTC